ncbi:MAG: type VI secretion system tip protein VgrG [Myxococcota bacterium]|nr:type VI secretion system tip protein VgrG [Myxococcota bacterium]
MDKNFFVTVSGDVPKSLLFSKMHGLESLGRLFEFDVELLSEDPSLDLSAVVGQSLTVRVELPSEAFRYFNGLVAQFKLAGTTGGYVRYQAVVRPAFWLLTRTANSRIFQRKTVPNVVKQIFRDLGVGDFEDRLSGNYRTWEYLVQYRESDWNFVSRLLEQEGIYFYFKHEEGKHTLVLADSAGAHDPYPGYETVPYFPADDQRRTKDNVSDWTVTRQLVSGAYAATDFNFETPKLRSLNRLSAPTGTAHDDLELYHYPGTFLNNKEGEAQVRVRLEEQQANCEVFDGGGEVRGLGSGLLFTLEEHPREDQNQEYLVVTSWYDAAVSGYETGGADTFYRCSFAAIPSSRQFRAAEETSKPRVEGPQTAIVVGPSGEEIWTDSYGRVKLQFHWDRDGKADENSSCWVRVSQMWAGTNWGAMHIPRIGQEVIVDFLEGDPDRPIVTGRVYNASNMPPYDLPKNGTQSGVKSRSTKGGAIPNFNEIRFEDRKGHEEFHVQAERNQSTLVKANQTVSVGADRTLSVGANETISVGAKRATTVAKKDTVVLQDEHEITVSKKVTQTYEDDQVFTLAGAQTTDIGKDKTEHVKQTYDLTTDQQFKLTQGGTTLTFQSNQVALDAAGAITVTRGPAKLTIDDSGQVKLSTPTGITFECGPNTITMSPSGIELKGPQIALNAGPSSLELGPASAKLAGAMTSVEATAICSVKGTAMLNLNS